MSKKFIITEEEKSSILKQYGIISEQNNLGKVDISMPSDYLGRDNSFERNYVPQVTTKNVSSQVDSLNKIRQQFEELKSKYANTVPYEEYYTSKNNLFQEWVRKKIRSIKPGEYASTFKNESIEFFKKYLDYNSKPEMINKIVSISNNNKKFVSESFVKETIDKLINDYLPKIGFYLDFEYNEKNPNTMMYVMPAKLDATVYICALNQSLIGPGYTFKDPRIWKESVLHEIGHLVDGYFNMSGIKFYSSDSGKKGFSKLVPYPHQSSSSNFFDFKFDELDSDKEYRQKPSEQFTRFKILFDILSKKGLKINSNLYTFIDSFQKSLDDETITIGYNICNTKIGGGILTVENTCESLKDVSTKKDFLPIYVDNYTNASLYWLFSVYTDINIINSNNAIELNKVNYTIDLNNMYQDWKNEYVLNTDKTNLNSKSFPDYPTA